ncbi:MAG: transposase [Akkermansiaceae bacterium]|nr:transposase [Akkermansiaceae bacterium]
MELIPENLRLRLIENSRASQLSIDRDGNPPDHWPVIKLFTPDAQATWLLTELNPDCNVAFGLADFGLGCPELGYVSLDELSRLRGHLGLAMEVDSGFEAEFPLSDYARMARQAGRIEA